MSVQPTSYQIPVTVDEAIQLATARPGRFQFVAGGTDVIPLSLLGLQQTECWIDLSRISELRDLAGNGNGMRIGALTTLEQLADSTIVRTRYPSLRAAALSVASPGIRNSATVGGNLLVGNRCHYYNQSAFWRKSIGSCLKDTSDVCRVTNLKNGKCFARNVSDVAPALIALRAVVVIREGDCERSHPVEDLYAADGLVPLSDVIRGRILLRIEIPEPPAASFFQKLRRRSSLDFTSLTVAGARHTDDGIRVCLNGIGMAPVVITGDRSSITFDDVFYRAKLRAKIADNDVIPLRYRMDMMKVYLEDLWSALDLC